MIGQIKDEQLKLELCNLLNDKIEMHKEQCRLTWKGTTNPVRDTELLHE